MANVLSLRTGGAALVKLDAAFYRGEVRALLNERGLAAGAFVDVDADSALAAADLEALFRGKVTVPVSSTWTAPASSWRAVLAVTRPREQRTSGSRDIGGDAPKSIATAERDWVRRPGGKKVKQRVKGKRVKLSSTAAPTQAAPASANDPAAFAVQHLARFVALVVDAAKGAPDAAVVVVDGGVVVVDGVRGAALAG